MKTCSRRRAVGIHGFSLVEVMIAMSIAIAAGLGLSQMIFNMNKSVKSAGQASDWASLQALIRLSLVNPQGCFNTLKAAEAATPPLAFGTNPNYNYSIQNIQEIRDAFNRVIVTAGQNIGNIKITSVTVQRDSGGTTPASPGLTLSAPVGAAQGQATDGVTNAFMTRYTMTVGAERWSETGPAGMGSRLLPTFTAYLSVVVRRDAGPGQPRFTVSCAAEESVEANGCLAVGGDYDPTATTDPTRSGGGPDNPNDPRCRIANLRLSTAMNNATMAPGAHSRITFGDRGTRGSNAPTGDATASDEFIQSMRDIDPTSHYPNLTLHSGGGARLGVDNTGVTIYPATLDSTSRPTYDSTLRFQSRTDWKSPPGAPRTEYGELTYSPQFLGVNAGTGVFAFSFKGNQSGIEYPMMIGPGTVTMPGQVLIGRKLMITPTASDAYVTNNSGLDVGQGIRISKPGGPNSATAGDANVPFDCRIKSAGAGSVTCDAGHIAMGGGADCAPNHLLSSSGPVATGTEATGWSASCTHRTTGAAAAALNVRAICCNM